MLWLLSRRAGRPGGASISTLPSPPSILLVRPDRIGDAIITTASIQLVRQRFPNATIGLLLGAKNAAVAELIPDINRTHVVPVSAVGTWKVMRAIRRTRYDLAINLVANDSASAAALTALSGAAWKIGFAGKSSTLYDAAIPRAAGPIHIVRETSLLLAPLGISPIGPQPLHNGQRLRVRLNQEAEDSGTVVLNISGSEPAKYWGTKNFTALCELLRQRGAAVAVACKPGDEAFAEQIVAGSGAQLIAPTRSFAQFAERLSGAAVIATPDTSIVHLSAALGKPTVVIAAHARSIEAWQPWGVPFRVVDGDGELTMIQAERVLAAILELLPPPAQSTEPNAKQESPTP